jgi:Glycosyl transferase family 2
MPLVSAIMAVRNGSRYLPAAIASILAQSVVDFDLIVVDDASTDDTAAVLRAVSDPRLRVLTNDRWLGQTESLNKALAIADGDYVARMDADDIAFPERFACQLDHLRESGAVATGSGAIVIDGGGRVLEWRRGEGDPVVLRWRMMFRNICFHSSLMWHRNQVEESVGIYDVGLEYAQDYDLLARLMDVGTVSVVERPLIYYRQHDAAMSHTWRARQDAQAAFIGTRVLRRFLPNARAQLLEDVRSIGGELAHRVPPERLVPAASAFVQVFHGFSEQLPTEVLDTLETRRRVRAHVSGALLSACRTHIRRTPKVVLSTLRAVSALDRSLAGGLIADLGKVSAAQGRRWATPRVLRLLTKEAHP